MPPPAARLLLVFLMASAVSVLPGRAGARFGPDQAENPPAGRWALLVAGISGDPELRENYLKLIMELRTTLEDSLGFPEDRVFVLFEDPALDAKRIQYKSTRENLDRACRDIANRATEADLFFIFLMGHGSFDNKGYKLNLVGPDPTGDELAAAIYAVPAGRFVVVNTTSCSGGSVPALANDKAILVTATKSGSEKNQTHMAEFFVEALKDRNADLDKNGRISGLEAFNYAAKKVEEYYSKQGLLQTEHPVLEDDGDRQAHSDPGPANGEGFLARITYLDAGPTALGRAAMSPEERALAQEAESLQNQIEKLKYAKSTMPQEEYERRLEELLLKLAEVNAKLRKK
jgi:hypothetical protein